MSKIMCSIQALLENKLNYNLYKWVDFTTDLFNWHNYCVLHYLNAIYTWIKLALTHGKYFVLYLMDHYSCIEETIKFPKLKKAAVLSTLKRRERGISFVIKKSIDNGEEDAACPAAPMTVNRLWLIYQMCW